MKTRSSLTPQVAFWGMCLVIVCWLAATFLFEIHLGWPSNAVQWTKRLLGWAVEAWLVRALMLGVRRFYQASPGR